MSENATKATPEVKKAKQGRSPAYPGLSIKEALAKARAFYGAEGKYAAPMPSAFAAWGFGAKSSGGREVRAALRYYGLIVVEGDGETGKVKLTDDALRILLDEREDQSEKEALILRCALKPPIFAKLREHFPDGIKSDATVTHFLIFEEGYNKTAADEVLATFKETAIFAKLFEPTIELDKLDKKSDNNGANIPPPKLNIGDKVQVTVDGTDMYAEGATILGFSDDGAWVFIDKSNSAAKVGEITLLEVATVPKMERPPIPTHLLKPRDDAPKGNRKAVFPISDGDVTLTFPEGITDAGFKRLKRYLDIFLDEQIEDAQKPT